jgi:tight adherence protein C
MSAIALGLGLLLIGTGIVAIVAVRQRSSATSGDFLAYVTQATDLDGDVDGATGPFVEPELGFRDRLVRPVVEGIVARTRVLYPSSYLDRVHGQLLRAGLSRSIRAEEFVTVQVVVGAGALLAGLLLAVLGSGSSLFRLVLFGLLAMIGLMGPKAWLSGRADRRVGSMERELPDVLDLMTISVEAGLGLEAAMQSVCDDFDSPLSEELARTLQEMNLGLSRQQALENLRARTDVEDLNTFILVLTQADILGMPIGRVLRTQADQMRERRRARAREKAAKLPVKILFPLMVFILPPLMIVVLGPAISGLMSAFSHNHL